MRVAGDDSGAPAGSTATPLQRFMYINRLVLESLGMPGPTRAIPGRLSTLSRCDTGGVASTTHVAKHVVHAVQPSCVQVYAWPRHQAATENAKRVVWQY